MKTHILAATLLWRPSVEGFSPPRPLHVATARLPLQSSADSDSPEKLREKASEIRREAEQLRLTLELKKIDELSEDVKDLAEQQTRNNGSDAWNNKLEVLQGRVADIVRSSSVIDQDEADELLARFQTTTTTSTTFAPEEVEQMLSLIDDLPRAARETLAITAGYLNYATAKSDPAFLSKLSSHQGSNMALRRTYAQSLVNDPDAKVVVVDESYTIEDIADALVEDLQDRLDGNRAMELFPRSVQDVDDELLPGDEDAEAIFRLLDSSTFMATEKPIRVNGGYLIRGVNKRSSSSQLIEAIDDKIAKGLSEFTNRYQVSFVEITADPNSEEFIEDSLLITPNKFPVRAPLALGIVATAISCFYTFTYGINTFAGNPVVMQRLKEANEQAAALAAGTTATDLASYDLSWFNDLLLPLLGSLAVIQGVHELGHLTVAWANNVSDRYTWDCGC